ncbi:undecaprenyl-diphosphate phosphatase [uncultured Brevundimonas sp.]|uniref:undecaprenyl-diphosphate phosphatase n=1 Tax=uncultured Brevundimonas sp. TaxID=213418 RepID=UPI0030EE3D21|tara:strand:+ start:25460 stop:26266 length:807 start_codon:yes stop_codon:yes gene_type:complete
MADWLAAIVLGLVEGLTEFIPVSSTGHLLLTQKLLGLTDPRWTSFIVLIQMGAILAVVALYFARLWKVLIGLPTDPKARHFAISVLIAFLPSVLVGLLLYDFIKLVLFDSVTVICVSLILGGFGLLILERIAPAPSAADAMTLSWKRSLGVGLFQCLAVIPGVSRSGATIAGGLTLGLDKRAAAEFSFFLAIPTMVAASTWDIVQSGAAIDWSFGEIIAIGFVVSFVSGWVVVKAMVDFVARHGFAPFAWWRIVIGVIGLGLVWAGVA